MKTTIFKKKAVCHENWLQELKGDIRKKGTYFKVHKVTPTHNHYLVC